MNIVVLLEQEQVQQLINKKRIDSIATIPNLDDKLLKLISRYLENNTGYSCKTVSTVSKVFGSEGTLRSIWNNMSTIVEPKENDFLLEMQIPDDLIVSIDYEDLLTFNEEFRIARGSSDDDEFLEEDLFDSLRMGELRDSDSVISFVPFIDIKYCRKYYRVSKNWETEVESSCKTIDHLSTERLSIF